MSELKFKTHNDNIEFQGGGRMGYIDVSYKTLKRVFGKPEVGDEYKSDAEWRVLFDNGVYATIYNYKDGKNYLGKEGTRKKEIRDWHVGGQNPECVDLVVQALESGNK